MAEIKQAIEKAFLNATEIRVTCPLGTDYAGSPNWGSDKPTDVCLKRFPLLVPKPVPASGFSGRIALSRFLIGTGSKFYNPYYLSLPHDVFAYIEDNHIIRFEGSDTDVTRVEDHYRDVANQLTLSHLRTICAWRN